VAEVSLDLVEPGLGDERAEPRQAGEIPAKWQIRNPQRFTVVAFTGWRGATAHG